MGKLLSNANDTGSSHIWNTLNDRLFEATGALWWCDSKVAQLFSGMLVSLPKRLLAAALTRHYMISGSKSSRSSRLDTKRGCLIGIRLPMWIAKALGRWRGTPSRHEVMSFKVVRLPINPIRVQRAKKTVPKAAVFGSNGALHVYLSKRKLKCRLDRSAPMAMAMGIGKGAGHA